eukprot:1161043-Pelagomonas_calceolata.AAC.1
MVRCMGEEIQDIFLKALLFFLSTCGAVDVLSTRLAVRSLSPSLASQNKCENGFPPAPAPGIPVSATLGKPVVYVFDEESTTRLNRIFAVSERAVAACSTGNFLFAVLDMIATISLRPLWAYRRT